MRVYKTLREQIIQEIEKRGGETAGEITIRGIIDSLVSPSASNAAVQAIYAYLGKALKEQIVSGLYTVADSPSSKYIWVKNKGEESVGIKAGVIYSLAEDTKIEVSLPQLKAPAVFFVNLTTDGRVLIENHEVDNELTLAKINIPYPQSIDVVDDYEKGAMSAYIVTSRDICFRNDFAIDDETIAVLRNSMNRLLADNLVGNIRLSEGLKILNQRGTLEMDSEEIRILYPSKVVGARFNKNGTYFFDESGSERARFTKDDARIGNIKITGHTLESIGYETEGFQIRDDGRIYLKDRHNYQLQLKPDGIYIKGKIFMVDHPPSDDDYIRDVVLRKSIDGDIISENSYNFGAKNGQFIKRSAYADNTPTYPDHIFVTYTTNEGTFPNEEHNFTMQDSVVAIITSDSLLDASYVRNLIVGKITNPAGNTYFDLLKGKLNIESIDEDEDNKFVIGDPTGGAGLRYDRSERELLISGTFATTGSKNWDSKVDFDGNKFQVDTDTVPGEILLKRELAQWLQTTQVDFDAGIKTNIDTTAEAGTFRLLSGNWLETITADFDAGIMKDNINTNGDEIKLLNQIDDPNNISLEISIISGGLTWTDPYNLNDNNIGTNAYAPDTSDGYIGINLGRTETIRRIFFRGGVSAWVNYPAATYGKLQYYDGSWHDIPGTEHYYCASPPFGQDIKDDDVYVSFNASQIRWYVWGGSYSSGKRRAYELYTYRKQWPTGHFRSQEKDFGGAVILGNFYESHLAGQTYAFKFRRYAGGAWSEWQIVENGWNLSGSPWSPAEKFQYDIVLTSANGSVNPIVYDIKVEYTRSNGNLISQNHHFGTNLHHWEPMVITKILYGQTLTIKTQTSPDVDGSPGDWEEEKSLDAQNNPTSTIYTDTWFRWIAYLSTKGIATPVVYDIIAKASKQYYSNGYDRLVWSFGSKVSYGTYSFVAEETPVSPVTNVRVRFRCADTEAGLDTADWSAYFDDVSGDMTDDNIFDSIWIEAEAYLETNDIDYSPDFDKLTVNFTQGLDTDKVDGKHLDGYQSIPEFLDIKTKGPWVDVRAFGAKGDETTDDTTAIQNALNYAETLISGGKGRATIVFFPPGRYKITDTLRFPAFVNILGVRATVEFKGSEIYMAATDKDIGTVIDGDWTCKDIQFRGYAESAAGTGRGIVFGNSTTHCGGVHMIGVSFYTMQQAALHFVKSGDGIFEGVRCESNNRAILTDSNYANSGHRFTNCVFFASPVYLALYGATNLFTNCFFQYSTSTEGNLKIVDGINNSFVNCVFEHATYMGAYIDASLNRFIGCNFRNNILDGLHLAGEQKNLVVGCSFTDNDYNNASAYSGVNMSGNTYRNSIISCNFTISDGATRQNWCVKINAGCNNNAVMTNHMLGGFKGAAILDNGADTSLLGNVGA